MHDTGIEKKSRLFCNIGRLVAWCMSDSHVSMCFTLQAAMPQKEMIKNV